MPDNLTLNGTSFRSKEAGGGHSMAMVPTDEDGSFFGTSNPMPVADSASATATGKLGSAKSWYVITPDGNADLNPIPDAIMCTGAAGNVVLKGSDGNNVVFPITTGQILPLAPTRVVATGTTAGGLIALIA